MQCFKGRFLQVVCILHKAAIKDVEPKNEAIR
jgi:hypothetical protein